MQFQYTATITLIIWSFFSLKFLESSQYVIHSQSLTVVMVGRALVVFCGILGHRTFFAVSKYKAIRKFSRLIQLDIFKRKDASRESQNYIQGLNSTNTTHSVVEMAGCVAPTDKLRESLLTSIVTCIRVLCVQ